MGLVPQSCLPLVPLHLAPPPVRPAQQRSFRQTLQEVPELSQAEPSQTEHGRAFRTQGLCAGDRVRRG